LIIFDCRQSGAKDGANGARKARRLKVGLILVGTLLTLISLTTLIISIYFLVIRSNTTITTGKNKVLLTK